MWEHWIFLRTVGMSKTVLDKKRASLICSLLPLMMEGRTLLLYSTTKRMLWLATSLPLIRWLFKRPFALGTKMMIFITFVTFDATYCTAIFIYRYIQVPQLNSTEGDKDNKYQHHAISASSSSSQDAHPRILGKLVHIYFHWQVPCFHCTKHKESSIEEVSSHAFEDNKAGGRKSFSESLQDFLECLYEDICMFGLEN